MLGATARSPAEFAFTWGDAGLVVRDAFIGRLVFRPGKGAKKSAVSFWEAKKMLETLAVAFDHAAVLPSPKLQGTTVVALTFFERARFEHALRTVREMPNHTVYANGDAIEIQVAEMDAPGTSSSSPLPATAMHFEKKMKGCRPDTVHLRGLPAKWFDVNTADFADIDAKLTHYNHPAHKLPQLFALFGALAHVEVVPPQDVADDGILATVHFDVYVQFKAYDSVVAILECMQGQRVLCHTAHPKLIVPLSIQLDTTEYLSDANIRQRRFAREQRQIQLAHELVEAEQRAKALAAEVAAATAAIEPLAARLKVAEARAEAAVDAVDAKMIVLLKHALGSLDAVRQAPSARGVEVFELALGGFESHLKVLDDTRKAKEFALARKKWQQRVAEQCETSTDHVAVIEAKFADRVAGSAFLEHPALVADIRAAKAAIAAARSITTHPISIDDEATEDDVRAYLDKLRDDVDEADCMVDAALARLAMLAEYHELQKQVTDADGRADALLQALDSAWGDSTATLLEKIRHIRSVLKRAARLRALSAAFRAANDDSEELCASDPSLAPLAAAAKVLVESLDADSADDAALTACDDAITAFATAAKAIRATRAEAAAAEKARSESFAGMQAAKTAAIASARQRLQAWQEEVAAAHNLERITSVVKRAHIQNRWPTVTSMDPPEAKRPKIVRSSLIVRQTPPRVLLSSRVVAIQDDGRALSPRSLAAEKVAREETALRTQVIESQKRKEAIACLQRLKEKELRQQALKSIAERSSTKTTADDDDNT
ncbi:hypothetical protein SPRG_19289 [Saprolegnia parasitica CBS 223.65]|uniref:Uncharacterized protein n=1 Tax=Saprolegnia parasitica (strain CBS 223.65) TaxID=695850 RepID=A0A067CSN5_SAPPC|nr:hypothetical protein SPRG_19289 [Saprolegnia parasitica CBS 223.65]KDO33679.1 hypothetical protein SPRG_19289 [Saprolegnia parasitica CBS 223.65]|eukprot:XP_012195706.1 hypothetical protein SPRG_19289 [Saprolegnia parasitica CBS 223.65]